MADSKRQPAAKVATPKTGPTRDMLDTGEVLFKAIGGRVKVVTAPHNTTYEGFLFAADPATNAIVINIKTGPPESSSKGSDIHVISIPHITSFTVLEFAPRGDGQGFDGCVPAIGPLDLKAIEAREEATVKLLKEEEARIKAGVTPEGQQVFDALARTLPVRWHDTSIIVSDSVIIKPPYGVDDCQAPKGKQGALPHVRKIMEALQQKRRPAQQPQGNANRPAVATPIAPRKGG